MPDDAAAQGSSPEEVELREAIDAVLGSSSQRKLVVAGPGTGKTTLFRRLLLQSPGEPEERIVLTFINTLKDDLEDDLSGLARVFTLHSYCLGLLHRHALLRGSLSTAFRCCPGLASLIAEDWEFIQGGKTPRFVAEMRNLAADNNLSFYVARGDYYDAVDFDDSVYRAYDGFRLGLEAPPRYGLVLIDEYQDFNALEAGVIDFLGEANPIVVAGDDDQALYGQLRDASWDHIRLLRLSGTFEVFTLPFCMRCPSVVVDAVRDVIKRARELGRLKGRIAKPYKHFAPVKGADSVKYPKIVTVQTSVQSRNVNYMGRYIEKAVESIPEDEIAEAASSGYPAALVIVAKPYRDQVVGYLEGAGYDVDSGTESSTSIDREAGLVILTENPRSNLGWRIVLEADRPEFLRDAVVRTADRTVEFVEAIPPDYVERVLAEVSAYEPATVPEACEGTDTEQQNPRIKVTSFEGAKGLSAAHVFIAGLHDGELPHDSSNIRDIEICKFIVGLTRTRKQCTLIHTHHFGTGWKTPSCFISWIDASRLRGINVDKAYWADQSRDEGRD
jgi:superfamily I DNA/RNA helicase